MPEGLKNLENEIEEGRIDGKTFLRLFKYHFDYLFKDGEDFDRNDDQYEEDPIEQNEELPNADPGIGVNDCIICRENINERPK